MQFLVGMPLYVNLFPTGTGQTNILRYNKKGRSGQAAPFYFPS